MVAVVVSFPGRRLHDTVHANHAERRPTFRVAEARIVRVKDIVVVFSVAVLKAGLLVVVGVLVWEGWRQIVVVKPTVVMAVVAAVVEAMIAAEASSMVVVKGAVMVDGVAEGVVDGKVLAEVVGRLSPGSFRGFDGLEVGVGHGWWGDAVSSV